MWPYLNMALNSRSVFSFSSCDKSAATLFCKNENSVSSFPFGQFKFV